MTAIQLTGTDGGVETEDGISLRQMTEADAAFDRSLHDANRSDLLVAFGDATLAAPILAMQFNARAVGYRADHPNAEYYLILRGDSPVGRIVVDRTPTGLRVVDVALMPEWQRQGIGLVVLQWVQQQAREASVPLRLSVRRDNLQAQSVYHRLGFALEEVDAVFLYLRWDA